MKTMTFTSKSGLTMLLGLAGLLSFVAPQARADEKDPPTRVARISYVDGSVSLQPGGQGDWGSAAKNRPMTIGDKIWVDKDSRAELQAGAAAMHLGSMTALSFLNLDQGITQMRLAEGSLNFRVRELRQGDLYEVDTPNLAFTIKEAGAFRIDVDENGDSARVTVIRGEGEVTAGGKTYEVHSGERAEFNGIDNIQSNIEKAPGPDGLDRWAEERDLKEDNSVSGRYVSRDTPGYSDLDDYGDWRDEPEYGHVWYPREVAPGWAPYSYGYWNWVGPWGWTWVDYDPWGFAPFHYGRWAYVGGAWGWCPGPYYAPPCYGPAFVGFLGGGFGFGVGFGVGWFPLGWGEPFYPWFGCSHNFVNVINVHNTVINNTNILNTTNIHNYNYMHAHDVHAVTAVNRETFVKGLAVNRGATHLTTASLKGAQVTNQIGIKPTPHSALGAVNVKSHVATPPASVQNRAVVARTTPAPGASHTPVRTVNSRGLVAGRVSNAPTNSAVNHSAAGATNQRAVAPNMPSRNAPATNNRPGNSPAINSHPGNAPVTSNRPSSAPATNLPSHSSPAMDNRPGNAPATNSRPNSMPSTSGMTPRQRDLSQNRPPSAVTNSNRASASVPGNTASQRAGNSPRTWEAQGNTTVGGRAPAGFGSSNRPANAPTQAARSNNANRPPWAGGGGQPSVSNGQGSRPSATNSPAARESTRPSTPSYNGNRPSSSNSGRSYEPPQQSQRNAPAYNSNSRPSYSNNNRSYTPPQRTYSNNSSSYGNRGYSQQPSYSAPSRSYSDQRTYSAPSRSYPAPSRSYSAPSRSYSGGGGSYSGGASRGGGGGSYSGGASRGGGGGVSHGGGGGGVSHGGGGGGVSHGGGGGGVSHGGGGGGVSHGGGGGGSHGHH